jgi:transcription antitermination factor NusG
MKPELIDQWVVVQVRSRSEQMVQTLLHHKGYDTYGPTLPVPAARQRQSRLEPLFPGYVFCKLGGSPQALIITTPGVLRFVGPGGRPEPVPASEIAAIQTVLASGLPARPAVMEPGSPVEVVSGPLKGCCGTVVECKSKGLILIGVSLLQRAVSVVVEAEWLRPLTPIRKAPASADVSRAVSNSASRLSAESERLRRVRDASRESRRGRPCWPTPDLYPRLLPG